MAVAAAILPGSDFDLDQLIHKSGTWLLAASNISSGRRCFEAEARWRHRARNFAGTSAEACLSAGLVGNVDYVWCEVIQNGPLAVLDVSHSLLPDLDMSAPVCITDRCRTSQVSS